MKLAQKLLALLASATALLVAAAAASNIIHSVVFDYYRNRYLAYVHGVGTWPMTFNISFFGAGIPR